jgi:hypothetical protein
MFLENNAFLSILIASIEKFPSTLLPEGERLKSDKKFEGESYGILFGQKVAKDNGDIVYNISMAIPMQVVKRVDSGSVTISRHHFDRINEVLCMYPNITALGSYHSHPWEVEDFQTGICTQPSDDEDGSGAGDIPLFRREAAQLGNNSVHIIFGLTKLARLQARVTPTYGKSWITSHFGYWKYKAHAYYFDIAADKVKMVHNFVCPVASGMQNFDLSS